MEFRGQLILAPVAGVTHSMFRLLCRENGADIVMTETVSAKAVLYARNHGSKLLVFREAERPIGVQLYGADPREMAKAAVHVEGWGFDFLDINMGCPASKVTRTGAGAALLSDPCRAGQIVRSVKDAVKIPVTAKMRSGFGTESENYLDVAARLFDAGVSAITLHPRHRSQMFSGKANWSHIAALKRAFPNEVIIGNGDVRSPADAARMLAETRCDSVMVGRGAFGNPWIFAAIQASRNLKDPIASLRDPRPTSEELRAIILRHGEEMYLLDGDWGVRNMRKHLVWYSRGLPNATIMRAQLPGCVSWPAFRKIVEGFF